MPNFNPDDRKKHNDSVKEGRDFLIKKRKQKKNAKEKKIFIRDKTGMKKIRNVPKKPKIRSI